MPSSTVSYYLGSPLSYLPTSDVIQNPDKMESNITLHDLSEIWPQVASADSSIYQISDIIMSRLENINISNTCPMKF